MNLGSLAIFTGFGEQLNIFFIPILGYYYQIFATQFTPGLLLAIALPALYDFVFRMYCIVCIYSSLKYISLIVCMRVLPISIIYSGTGSTMHN